MVVRDEDDILPQCLAHLLGWVDAVYILDLGSKDLTWDIVQDAAAKDKRVVPFKSQPYRFDDSIRSYIFHSFRSRFHDGDWVLRLDADEFYHIPPPQFIAERVLPHESLVHLAWYYFRLTSEEVGDYERGTVPLNMDRQRPIEQRRRWYKIPDYAEPRMFKYRSSIRWPASRSLPFNAGFAARERIPIRHYPHRDPEQMQKRYRLRAAMMELQADAGPHWRLKDWSKDVLQVDGRTGTAAEQTSASEGLSAAEGHTAGDLLFWNAGTPLPPITGTKHLSKGGRRTVQRVIYPHLVRWLDPCRQAGTGREPLLLPAEIQARL